MNAVAKSLQINWFKFAIASVAVLLPCSAWVFQGSFKPQTATQDKAYSNGSSSQAPGVSSFRPQATNDVPPTFQSRGSQLGAGLQGESFANRGSQESEIGETSVPGFGMATACTVEFKDEVDLSALETGQLIEVNVREGETVPAGKTIARVDDKLIKHQLRQVLITKANAERIAKDSTSIEAADKQIQLTRHRYKTTSRLASKGARSADDKLTAEYEYDVARLQRRAAVMRQQEAMGEAELETARSREVEDRLARHSISSKYDGAVVELFKQEGEWVTAGEPIAKVARMDKLYVTGLVPNKDYNPHEVAGKDVVVTVLLANNETMEFTGKITTIGLKDIPGIQNNNDFLVKAEIDNKMQQGQWVLRKDARVTMRFKVN